MLMSCYFNDLAAFTHEKGTPWYLLDSGAGWTLALFCILWERKIPSPVLRIRFWLSNLCPFTYWLM